jgi:hypothetical protein
MDRYEPNVSVNQVLQVEGGPQAHQGSGFTPRPLIMSYFLKDFLKDFLGVGKKFSLAKEIQI